MSIKKRGKDLFDIFLRTLNPRYYTELADKEISKAVKYFLTIILIAFIIAEIIALPKILTLKSDFEKGLLEISEFKIDADFQTLKPISLPRDRPLITLDTTDNKTRDTELLLVTDETMYYNISGKSNEITLSEYDFTQNKESSKKLLIAMILFILPSILIFYYLAYAIKYLVIIIALSFISFALAKLMKNKITLRQSVVLALYTSTIMVFLEILTIPFQIRKYIITFSPILGVNFSIVAITLYLTLYITSIRINGNTELND